jgi:hypothetical protein
VSTSPPAEAVGAAPVPVLLSRDATLLILAAFPLAFVVFGLLVDGPVTVARGLLAIMTSRDTLITDYIGLGGMGAAFVNAGLLTLIVIFIYRQVDAVIGGASVACIFLVLGFALFGKSLLNVWFIVLGVVFYARYKGERFATHINTAFFGAALAPVFSEILFSTKLPLVVTLPLSVATALLLGFVLAPVAAQLFKAHMGYSLYNMGFAAGILGLVIVALYKSYGFVPEPVFIWTTGNNLLLGGALVVMFAAMAATGFWLDRRAPALQRGLMRLPGQSPTDFVAIAGLGPTLLNMSLTGLMGTAYVLLIGSALNGPTIGAILTIVGFAAFGKTPRNILPIMLGVVLGSLLKPWAIDDPGPVLAALFGTTLAPIAGRFGWRWGVVAGFMHSSVVQTVGALHGGLVLYNNGFAAGLVAAVLVPVIIALRPAEAAGKD